MAVPKEKLLRAEEIKEELLHIDYQNQLLLSVHNVMS